MKPREIQENEKSRIKLLILNLLNLFTFLPILASILAPMFVLFAFFIYISYHLFLYPKVDIVNYYFLVNPGETEGFIVLMGFESLVFFIGLILFGSGLYTLVCFQRKKPNKLVTKGFYRYIRHPQNWGILLMSFPFALFIPGLNDIGIRSGDLLSWSIFMLLMGIKSLEEEKRMLKTYQQAYWDYMQQSGYFLPRIHRIKKNQLEKFSSTNKKRYFRKKYFEISIIFIVFINLILLTVWVLGEEGKIRFPGIYFFFISASFNQWIPFILLAVGISIIGLSYWKKSRNRTGI